MACFVVPLGEAIVTTVVQKVVEKSEKKSGISATWSKRLSWLNTMLWGGSLMLVIDHAINGEIIATPPFFIALGDTTSTAIMLREIATTGVAMAATVTAVWGILVLVAEVRSRTAIKAKAQIVS